jgi:hypothetical protein
MRIEALSKAENKSWGDIGFPSHGVDKIIIDVSEFPVSCASFEIVFERGKILDRLQVDPTCCLKNQVITLLISEGSIEIKPVISSKRQCSVNCLKMSQRLHDVYCRRPPKTLNEIQLLMNEMKTLLFIHGVEMDKLCFEHTLSNLKMMKSVFNKQEAVVKKFTF